MNRCPLTPFHSNEGVAPEALMTHERAHRMEALGSIAERYDISTVYAFGSRASGVAVWIKGQSVDIDHIGSDVDIGVLPRPKTRLPVQKKVQLAIELEDLLGVCRVDLVVLPEVDPFLALDVIKGEIIYCDELDAEAEYQLYVMRKAGDLAYYERERRSMILGIGK